jgi:hypothetical protein
MPRVRRTGGISKEDLETLTVRHLNQPPTFTGTWREQLPYLVTLVKFVRRAVNQEDLKLLGHALEATEAAVKRAKDDATYREAARLAAILGERIHQLKPEVLTPRPSPPSSPRAVGSGQAQSRGRRRQSSMSSQGIDEAMIAPEFEELYDFLERERLAHRAGIDIASDALVYMCGPPGLVFDFLSQRGMLPFPLGQVELDHWMRMVMWQINRYREDNGLSWRHEERGGRRPRRGGRDIRPPVEHTPPPPPPPPEEEFDLYQLPPEEEFDLIHPVVQYFVEFLDWVIEHPDGYTPYFLYARLNQALNLEIIQDLLFGLEVNMTIQNYENFPNSEEFLGYMLDWMRDTIMRIEEWMADNNLRFNEDVTYFVPPY